MEITPKDIERYCGKCEQLGDMILTHGTVSSFLEDILKDGLLVRSKDFPTVRFSRDFKNSSRLDYEWCEPRGKGESANVFLQVPKEVIEKIKEKGLPLSQETIFDEICEDIELEVPDTPETRENFIKSQHKQNIDDRLDITTGAVGPKFSEWGAKPGTKYTHVGVPPQYICAIASSTKVFYASDRVKDFAKSVAENENNIHTNKPKSAQASQSQEQEVALTLDEAEKLF